MRGKLRVRGPWGPFSKVEICGGPWTSVPKGAFGICMAPEVLTNSYLRAWPGMCPDVMVNVKDFSTPDPNEVRMAAMMGLNAALYGRSVYVGCGFGIGRTGTLLGLMARIANPKIIDPVAYIRKNYYSKAIETRDQQLMVMNLNVLRAQKLYQSWLWKLRRRSNAGLLLTRDVWMDRPHYTTGRRTIDPHART